MPPRTRKTGSARKTEPTPARSTRVVPRADVVRRSELESERAAAIARLPSGDLEPLQLYSDDVPDEIEVRPLFYLDDQEYCIPTEFPTNVALQYLRMARVEGENVALGWLLEEILGEEGYSALMNYRGLKPEHLQHVNTVVGQLALGSLDAPKGRSATG
jgi:hypothetical protein